MRYPQADSARSMLDSAVASDAEALTRLRRPAQGWLRTVREALNMPQRELARRLGISQPSAQALEQREVVGTITLESLERAANALGCDLVYALIPRQPLETTLREQAAKVARAQWSAVEHTMALEDQTVPPDGSVVEELTRRTMAAGTAVWRTDA